MKMKKYYFLMLVMVLALLSSCSKVPNYAKVIPDDALLVVRIDAKQLAEKSGIGENDKVKKKFKAALKDADLSRGLRNKVEDLLEDPSATGIDLSQPLFVYVAQDDSDVKAGIVGGVSSKDDLTELLNGLAKEADVDKVVEEKEYNYFSEGKECIVFADSWFYFGQKNWDEDVEDYADDISSLFAKEAKNSIVETEDFQKMCSANGVAQLLLSGKGMGSIRDFKEISELMPKDLDIEEVAYLMDLTIDNGEAALTTEVLSKSDEWKDYLAKYDDLMGDVNGDLLQYIGKDGLAIFANINGENAYDELKEFGLFKEMGSEERDMVKKVLRSINGDVAFGMTDFNMEKGIPVVAAYLQTKDNSIVNVFAQSMGQEMEQKASNQYTVSLGNDYSDYGYSSSSRNAETPASMGFGFKNNISYIVTGANPKEFATASGAFAKSDLKGKKFYAYFGFAMLKKFSKTISSDYDFLLNGVLKICDYAELYYEGNGKSVLRLVTKDKDVTPLAALIDFGVEVVEKMQNLQTVGDVGMEEMAVDSVAVDEDYAFADSVAAW